jgi:hypothetical protein
MQVKFQWAPFSSLFPSLVEIAAKWSEELDENRFCHSRTFFPPEICKWPFIEKLLS